MTSLFGAGKADTAALDA